MKSSKLIVTLILSLSSLVVMLSKSRYAERFPVAVDKLMVR